MPISRTFSFWTSVAIAAAASVIVNLAILFIGKPLVGLTQRFAPLNVMPVIMWSIIGVIGATILFALVRKFSRSPDRLFLIIAIIVLVVSFVPDIAVKKATSGPFAGATWEAVLLLMFMHVAEAAIVLYMFLFKTRPVSEKLL